MASHSPGVTMAAQASGGVMKSLMRATMGGESLFVTTFTADPGYGGWVDLAANLPGDATVVEVTQQMPWVITRGSWLGGGTGVTLDTKWGGAKSIFGGEGAFVIHATGQGPVILSAYGAMDLVTLEQGQWFTLDTGHLVAYQASAQVQVRKAASGIVQSVKSGEGLVMDIAGPAQVLTQSRNPDSLVSWLSGQLPSRN
jgi:uncharacterized protein (TIGR00266 family)